MVKVEDKRLSGTGGGEPKTAYNSPIEAGPMLLSDMSFLSYRFCVAISC